MLFIIIVFCKIVSSINLVFYGWRSYRKKYLVFLVKFKFVYSIEFDICFKVERVCYFNDYFCCFIIRDIYGGSVVIFFFGIN